MKKFFAESFGTYILVFAGTGAIVINQQSGGVIGHAGIALTFGLVVMAMIHTFGDVSGAHLNPAVTIGLAAAGRFSWKSVTPYLLAQALGAVSASASLRLLFPSNSNLGATLPSGSNLQSFVLEVILTWVLMLVILSMSSGSKEKLVQIPVAVGGVIALEAMFAGPICGASMNPFRSLGPALVSGHVESLWIYIVAPVVGALLAVPSCCVVRESGCCGSGGVQSESACS